MNLVARYSSRMTIDAPTASAVNTVVDCAFTWNSGSEVSSRSLGSTAR